MRVRGLKQSVYNVILCLIFVAPHAGAWIETFLPCCLQMQNLVAPHAGAWIETCLNGIFASINFVAPHAGAWIETLMEIRRLSG